MSEIQAGTENKQSSQRNAPPQQNGGTAVAKPRPQNAVKRVETNPLLMSAEHWSRLKEVCSMAVASGMLPKHVDTPQKAFTVAMKGNELGFTPMYALEHLSVINGKPTIGGQAMLMLILSRGGPGTVCDLVTPVEDELKYGEWEMQRPGRPARRFKFTMEDAKRAEVLGNTGWKKYPRAMLRWRALAEGARIIFPDIIAGLYLHEEMGAVVDESGNFSTVDFRKVHAAKEIQATVDGNGSQDHSASASQKTSAEGGNDTAPPSAPTADDENAIGLGFPSFAAQRESWALLNTTLKASGLNGSVARDYAVKNFNKAETVRLTSAEAQELLRYIDSAAKGTPPVETVVDTGFAGPAEPLPFEGGTA